MQNRNESKNEQIVSSTLDQSTSTTPFAIKNEKVNYRTFSEKCDLLLVDQLTKENVDKLPILTTNVAYVCVMNEEKDQLYYVDKITQELTHIELTQDKFNQIYTKLNPKVDSRRLTEDELQYMASMTDHVPSMRFCADEFSSEVIINNNNISCYISKNISDPRFLYSDKISEKTLEPTQILVQGGNLFHCVNPKGESYVIAGEAALVSQNKIYQEITADEKNKIGKKLNQKYLIIEFKEKEEIIKQRQLNKQILKKQAGDAKVVIVPNSFFFHIDLEMCALPNGVVLVHSYQESLRLLEDNKDKLRESKSSYDNLFKKTLEHAKKSEHLFEKTARKLKKRGFIVIPVCGFLTLSDDVTAIKVTGFNGLPVVTKSGKILYTLPQNPEWYQDYFKKILEAAGVSFITTIQSENLSYIASHHGFFRCQTNTIPNKMIKSPEQSSKSFCSLSFK